MLAWPWVKFEEVWRSFDKRRRREDKVDLAYRELELTALTGGLFGASTAASPAGGPVNLTSLAAGDPKAHAMTDAELDQVAQRWRLLGIGVEGATPLPIEVRRS